MKKNKLKGRKWTPEQIAKAVATRARNRELRNRITPEGFIRPAKGTSVAEINEKEREMRQKDAISYLTTALGAETSGYMRCLVQLALYTLKGVK
jgi:hypothetical protein